MSIILIDPLTFRGYFTNDQSEELESAKHQGKNQRAVTDANSVLTHLLIHSLKMNWDSIYNGYTFHEPPNSRWTASWHFARLTSNWGLRSATRGNPGRKGLRERGTEMALTLANFVVCGAYIRLTRRWPSSCAAGLDGIYRVGLALRKTQLAQLIS